MEEVGRPSLLTPELTLQIRRGVLEGKTYKDIQAELDINSNTWDIWVYRDHQDFRKELKAWKFERFMRLTEKLTDEILTMNYLTEKGDINTEILRVKQKESEFVRETLGKNDYSKRAEMTGKDGKDLPTPIIMLPKENND